MKPSLRYGLLLCVAFLVSLANAQDTPPTVSLKLSSAKVKPGEAFQGVVTVTFGEGLHGYQNPPSEDYMIPVAVKSASKDVTLVKADYPKGKDLAVGGSPDPVRVYDGTIQIPVVLKAPTKAGAAEAAIEVSYQQCTDTACFAPNSVTAKASFEVASAEPSQPPVKATPNTTGQSTPEPPVNTPPKETPPKAEPVQEPKVEPAQPGQVEPAPAVTAAEEPPGPDTPVSSTDPVQTSSTTTAPLAASQTESTNSGGLEGLIKRAFDDGNYALLMVLMLAVGLILAATPCVYPVIPVTISFFSNQAAGSTAGRVGLGFMYALGIAVTYGATGAILLSGGAALGSLFTLPWFLFALAALMVALSLSMFGLYEIRLPAFIGKRVHGRSGVAGALVMGMLMGFAAAPCAGPALLAVATKMVEYRLQGSLLGLMLFMTIGFGLGLPFVALGAISTGAKALPKSGGWLKTLKSILGIVVLGVGLGYLLQGLGFRADEQRSQIVWAVFFIASAAYLFLLENSGTTKAIMAIKGGAVLVLGLLAGQALHTNVIIARDAELARLGAANRVAWIPFSEEAFASAKASGKPILVDVTADWCTICHEIEEAVFKKPTAIAAMQNVVAIRVDHSAGVDRAYLDKTTKLFGIKGLPHIEVLKPGGERARPPIVGKAELESPEQLKQHLRLAGAAL